MLLTRSTSVYLSPVLLGRTALRLNAFELFPIIQEPEAKPSSALIHIHAVVSLRLRLHINFLQAVTVQHIVVDQEGTCYDLSDL